MDDQSEEIGGVLHETGGVPSRRGFLDTSLRVTRLAWQLIPANLCGQTILSALQALQPVARSAMVALLINNIVRTLASRGPQGRSYDVMLLACLAALTLFATWCDVLLRYWAARACARLTKHVELEVIRQHAALDVERQEQRSVADLATRVIESGSWRLPNFFQREFEALRYGIGVLLALMILGVARWPALIVIVITSIPEFVTERRHGQVIHGIHGAESEVRRRYYDLRGHFYHIGSLGELKLYQNCSHFLSKIRDLYGHFQGQLLDAEHRKMRQRFVSMTISQGGVVVAMVDVALQAIRGEIQVGTLSLLLMNILFLRQSLSGLFSVIGEEKQDSLFIDDYFEFMAIRPAIQSPVFGIKLDAGSTPHIVFEDVVFTYPEAQRPAIRGVSLDIPAGSRVAIVGENGSGKSTLIKLLCRFHDPDQGRILVDGHDLRTLDLDSWYQIVGALLQEYARYHLSVREAISLGRTEFPVDMERVEYAARSSEMDNVVAGWQRGYDQQLGKMFADGIEPSVGQWQRLALARTFYRDARVLVLDEPVTSADPQAEFGIFRNLEASSRDRTILLSSHALSTVRQADKIIVLGNGRIVEQGSHMRLIERNGVYAGMFGLQANSFQ